MKKGKKISGLGFLLCLIFFTINTVFSAEVSNSEFIYLNYGQKIKCDKAWIASEDIIRCKKGNDEILYSTDEVNIKKTFGITLEDWKSTYDKEKTDTGNFAQEEEPKTINTIHLRDGTIINCDIAWQGFGDNILCQKSDEIFAYNIVVVDLETTFGEVLGKKIGMEYERQKGQVLMVKSLPDIAFDPDENKLDIQSHGSIDQRSVELEIRRLEEKLRYYKGTCISKARASKHINRQKKRFISACKKNAQRVERKLEELKNDPEYYFYKKHQGNISQKTNGLGVNRTHARSMQESKPQWLHDPFTGNMMPRTGIGYTDPRTGTFYHDTGSGVVNTRTGEFIPTH